MTFGENLQRLRKQAGLSQEDVAQKLFISRQSVSKWENGGAEPGIEHLKALAKLCGVTVDELVGMPRLKQKRRQRSIRRITRDIMNWWRFVVLRRHFSELSI